MAPPDASTVATDEAESADAADRQRRRDRNGDVQQRHSPPRAQGRCGHARANRSEEGGAVLQRGAAAQRGRQSGRAPYGDQRGGAGARVDLSGGRPRTASHRSRWRCHSCQRTWDATVLGRRRRQAVLGFECVTGHADVACIGHRRPGVSRHERFRRSVRPRAARHVCLLPARIREHQPGEGRTVPPYSGQGSQAGTPRRGTGGLLRGSRLCAHEQDGPRGAAPGTVAVRRLRHRSAGHGCVRLFPPGARSILRPARRRRPGIRRAAAARQGQGQAGARRARPRDRRTGTTRRPHSADAAAAARIGRQPRRRIRFCISRV